MEALIDIAPYATMWVLAVAIALVSVRLYRNNHPVLSGVTAALPAAGAAALFVRLILDFRLPHDDGIPITTLMRWFMLDDDVLRHRDAGMRNGTLLVVATALFCVGMLLFLFIKTRKYSLKNSLDK